MTSLVGMERFFSYPGSLVVSPYANVGKFCFYSPFTRKIVHNYEEFCSQILRIKYFEQGGTRFLSFTNQDNGIYILNLSTFLLSRLDGHTYLPQELDHILLRGENNGLLTSCGIDGQVKIWNVRKMKCEHTFKHHGENILQVRFLDERTMFTSSLTHDIRRYDLVKCVIVQTARHDFFRDFCLKPKSNLLIGAGYGSRTNFGEGSKSVSMIDIQNLGLSDIIHIGQPLYAVENISESYGNMFVVGTNTHKKNKVYKIDIRNSRRIKYPLPFAHKREELGVKSIVDLPSMNSFSVCTRGKYIHVMNYQEGTPIISQKTPFECCGMDYIPKRMNSNLLKLKKSSKEVRYSFNGQDGVNENNKKDKNTIKFVHNCIEEEDDDFFQEEKPTEYVTEEENDDEFWNNNEEDLEDCIFSDLSTEIGGYQEKESDNNNNNNNNNKKLSISESEEEEDEFFDGSKDFDLLKGKRVEIELDDENKYFISKCRKCPYCKAECHFGNECKHSRCSECKKWFCHVCLRVPPERPNYSPNAYNYFDGKIVKWECGEGVSRAWSICPPNPKSPNRGFIFPFQSSGTEKYWFVYYEPPKPKKILKKKKKKKRNYDFGKAKKNNRKIDIGEFLDGLYNSTGTTNNINRSIINRDLPDQRNNFNMNTNNILPIVGELRRTNAPDLRRRNNRNLGNNDFFKSSLSSISRGLGRTILPKQQEKPVDILSWGSFVGNSRLIDSTPKKKIENQKIFVHPPRFFGAEINVFKWKVLMRKGNLFLKISDDGYRLRNDSFSRVVGIGDDPFKAIHYSFFRIKIKESISVSSFFVGVSTSQKVDPSMIEKSSGHVHGVDVIQRLAISCGRVWGFPGFLETEKINMITFYVSIVNTSCCLSIMFNEELGSCVDICQFFFSPQDKIYPCICFSKNEITVLRS